MCTDISSFGVVLYEMITLQTLCNRHALAKGIKDSSFKELIQNCCKSDPKERPSMNQVVDTLEQINSATEGQGLKKLSSKIIWWLK